MPVSTAVPSISYNATGSATVYAFPFKVVDVDHLTVTLDGTIVTNYTVSGVGNDGGGDLTFTPAPTGTMVIRRIVPLSRETDYQPSGAFREETIDADQDLQTMQVQQVAEEVGRSIRVKAGLSPITGEITPAANTVIGFDNDGEPTVFPAQAGSSLADLAAPTGADLIGIGNTTVGAKLDELPSAKDAGAVGDGVTDDKLAFQNFYAAGGIRYIEPGNYKIGSLMSQTYLPQGALLVGKDVNFVNELNLPHCLNNDNHKIKDTYFYREYTAGYPTYGDVPLSSEAYAKPGSVGNVCGLFAGVRGESAADIWGFNTVTRAATGFTGIAQGYEVDVDVLSGSAPSEVFGVNVTGLGDLSAVQSTAFNAARAGSGSPKWKYGFTSLSAVNAFVASGATVGYRSQGSNSNALVIVPKDDTAPTSAQIVLFAADGSTVKTRLDNDGNMVLQSLQFGNTTGSKTTNIRNGYFSFAVNVPAGGYQNIILDGSSGKPSVTANIATDCITFNLASASTDLLWCGAISVGTGYAVLTLRNFGASAITNTYGISYCVVSHS